MLNTLASGGAQVRLNDPKSWLTFVQLDPFVRAWARLGCDDNDLRALEMAIQIDPSRSPVEPGTGGLRKLRFSRHGTNVGKRASARVCYAYFPMAGTVVLVTAYGKSEKLTLTPRETQSIRSLLEEIDRYLRHRLERG